MDGAGALALVTLAELPRVGERTIARVLRLARWKGLPLAEVLRLPTGALAAEYGLPRAAIARLEGDATRHANRCRDILLRLGAVRARISEPEDSAYPRRWVQRADPPPALVYLWGNAAVLESPTLAILNSRIITEQSVTATMQVSQWAVREGFALVTGGMKTTHRIAAVSVRAVGAPRIIVLDRGLLASFGSDFQHDPFGFGPGRARLDPCATLVLSPFRPCDHATPRSGRRRDELIAALGDIVIAVSARPGGEIERICLRALDHGHAVLSWQGGNSALVAAGAPAVDERDLRNGLRRFLAGNGR